ncbi:hypothetical protein Btru_069212 [Bulinus truncatus]|nr:hypothetical protein Btru_069212 [Bulinus truncatus]
MAGGTNESFQYKFEVQEATEGTDGEVIIIYNYDGEEITPELLAKTLEELSTQLSMQRSVQNQHLDTVAVQESDPVVCQPCENELQIALPIDSNHLDVPIIKVEVIEDGQTPDTLQDRIINNNSVHSSNDENCIQETAKEFDNAMVKNVKGLKYTVEQEEIVNKEVSIEADSGALPQAIQTVQNKKISTLPMGPLPKVPTEEDILSDEEELLSDYSCDKCKFSCQKEIDFQRHQKKEHKEKSPFICRHCGKAFQLELSLSIHKLVHSKKICGTNSQCLYNAMKSFTCPLCDFQYQKKRQLNTHIKTVHENISYHLCSKCNFACLTKEDLEKHLSSSAHDVEGRTSCPLCGTATKDIRQHLRRTHNDDRPYLCTQCGFKAKTVTHLNTHMVIHDPVKRVQCNVCDYKCRTKDQLKKHLVKHSAEKSFKCNLCDFACKTAMSLKRHMQIHKAPNKYVCNICQFTTQDKLLLRQHKSKTHVLKASYKCRECTSQFDRVVELKKHALAEHKSENTNFCSYCDFAGLTTADLRTHMQTHFGKFSYICNTCGYMCRLKASYQRHIERHSKVKKFKCTQCTYASVEKYDLQKHYVHRHSDDKPLSCPYCPYRCKFKPRLNNHISYVHTDVKPFFCKLCPYAGKSAENLKKHMANHGLVLKTLQCVLCDYATAEKAKLKRHMQVHVKKAVFQCRKNSASTIKKPNEKNHKFMFLFSFISTPIT